VARKEVLRALLALLQPTDASPEKSATSGSGSSGIKRGTSVDHSRILMERPELSTGGCFSPKERLLQPTEVLVAVITGNISVIASGRPSQHLTRIPGTWGHSAQEAFSGGIEAGVRKQAGVEAPEERFGEGWGCHLQADQFMVSARSSLHRSGKVIGRESHTSKNVVQPVARSVARMNKGKIVSTGPLEGCVKEGSKGRSKQGPVPVIARGIRHPVLGRVRNTVPVASHKGTGGKGSRREGTKKLGTRRRIAGGVHISH